MAGTIKPGQRLTRLADKALKAIRKPKWNKIR